jgi:hypothetical protein
MCTEQHWWASGVSVGAVLQRLIFAERGSEEEPRVLALWTGRTPLHRIFVQNINRTHKQVCVDVSGYPSKYNCAFQTCL